LKRKGVNRRVLWEEYSRGHLERERGYSASSRATILSDLRGFFSFFTAQKAIKCNPTKNIRIKKPKKNDKTAISEEEPHHDF
jgi:site-specific recombinase XerD